MTALLQINDLPRQTFALPELRQIAIDELPALQQLFNQRRSDDSYSKSAAYFAMTGRKGLWLYTDGSTAVPIVAHPNRENHLLLFPPIGRNGNRLLDKALSDPRIADGNRLQIARISESDGLLRAWAVASGKFTIENENVLDWTYPVHILGTHQVASHEGQGFRDFRKNISRAEARNLTTRPIASGSDLDTVINLAKTWARSSPHDGYSDADLIAPTTVVVDLMRHSKLPLHGSIVQQGDDPQGFIIWEETDRKAAIANSLCNTSLVGKGTSELAYLSMAKTLVKRGFDRVCIGGSETAGLDAFKRKMQPVRSIGLHSAAFKPVGLQ